VVLLHRQDGQPTSALRARSDSEVHGGSLSSEAEDRRASHRPFPAPVLSVVVPAYNEEGNVGPFHEALEEVLRELGLPWELLLVDDGSQDATWERVRALCERDARVRGTRLSRNFGHQYALLAGLARARGKAVVSMDADLQHPPGLIPRLVEEWRRGSRVVHTVRRDSGRESRFKRMTSRLFYRLFSFLSGTRLEPGMADFRLLDRKAVDALLGFEEEGLFLRGLVHWMGFPSSQVEFECQPRFSGHTSYTLRRMLRFAWTGVTSFSLVPLRMCVVVGLLTAAFSFEQLLEALYRKLVLGGTVPGWTQTMVVLSFLFGVLFILLGIIGEYIGRILVEVRRRPRYFVSEEAGAFVEARPVGAPSALPGSKTALR
jgi:glycosyltransferase involved in cell wall biosynthesis